MIEQQFAHIRKMGRLVEYRVRLPLSSYWVIERLLGGIL